jgi:hypothetical protein
MLALAGCGSPGSGTARRVAVEFEQALGARQAAHACDLLAPRTKSELEQSAGKSCPQALLEEDLPDAGEPADAEVFGTSAQVRFGNDVLFLGEYQGGWKVVAAGCTPRPKLPYDCVLAG